jgi:hypothetical protein
MVNNWVSVDESLPESGRYTVLLTNNGKEVVTERFFTGKDKGSRWMGGCRPFCENDVVLKWRRKE